MFIIIFWNKFPKYLRRNLGPTETNMDTDKTHLNFTIYTHFSEQSDVSINFLKDCLQLIITGNLIIVTEEQYHTSGDNLSPQIILRLS